MHSTVLNGVKINVLDPGDPGYGEIKKERSKHVQDLKVSEKKALSLYGLRRFPITLYADEWEVILANSETIKAFIETHPELSRRS